MSSSISKYAALMLVVPAAVVLILTPQAVAAKSVDVNIKPVAKSLTTRNARTTIKLTNRSNRRLSGLTLTVGARKGVRVTVAGARRHSRTRRLAPLRAGRTMRVTVRLRRTRKGPRSGTLSVRVRHRRKSVGSGRLAFGRAARQAQSMVGRHYWGSEYSFNGNIQRTLYFATPNLVHVADLKNAWPSCSAVSEVCRPYTFNAATGSLTIDGKVASQTGKKLELGGQTYYELGEPVAGARWDIVLTYANSSGVCPLYCSYFSEYLTFRPDGTFIRSTVASGSGPVDWATVSPDSKGSYEVRRDRTLRLAFENGKERIETLGIFPSDAGSYPANPSAGIVLGNNGYFDIRS